MTSSETKSGASLELGDGVLHFLRSLGKRSEAELYLRVFRDLDPGKFALLVPTRGVLEEHAHTVAEQLGFLQKLGLTPSILLGAVDTPSRHVVDEFERAIGDVGLVVRHVADPQAAVSLQPGEIPIYSLPQASDDELVSAVAAIAPRKLLFLRRAGGLGPHGGPRFELAPGHFLPVTPSGIGVINLRSDASDLRAGKLLREEDLVWLSRCERVLGELADSRSTISIASPLSILGELFTVRGEGTLVKLGSAIESSQGGDDYGPESIGELLEQAFGRKVKSSFWSRAPLRVYRESRGRGLAVLESGHDASAAFLSKFAVLPVARGEGLGQDLWWALSKETPAVYWRARPDNPINAWYRTVCDGMHRDEKWIVYWRGVPAAALAAVIADAMSRPEDFERD